MRHPSIIGLGAAVMVILSIMTAARSAVWSQPLLLWSDAVNKSPMKPRPRINLARALQESGDWIGAAREYRNAMTIAMVRPQEERMIARQIASVNLSQMLIENGSPEALREAERILTIAWNEEPGFPGVAVNLGSVWLNAGKPKMAVQILNMGETRADAYPWWRDKGRIFLVRSIAKAKLQDCSGAFNDAKLSGFPVDVQCHAD